MIAGLLVTNAAQTPVQIIAIHAPHIQEHAHMSAGIQERGTPIEVSLLLLLLQ